MKAGYTVSLSYESDFVRLLDTLQSRYPSQLFEIQGLANRNLDINEFSKSFFRKSATSNVANVSVDPNSNVGEMHIAQWSYEHPKGVARLNSMYLLWDSVKKNFSQADADRAVELFLNGSIFVNDSHQFERPYCFGFDLSSLCERGLEFFSSLRIGPPKRTDSFIDLLIQATAFLSNQITGATSYPTLFVNLDWYLQKDFGDSYLEYLQDSNHLLTYTIRNYFQKLIYSWGFPFRGAQSPFVNVSLFDRGFLHSLFGLNEQGNPKYVNPDGTAPNLDSIYLLQKHFYEYFDSIFGVENIFTFPVVTLACSIGDAGDWVDEEFVDWVCRVYPDKCIANIYCGKPTSFSSCCRMKNDFERLTRDQREYQNSFGVGGVSIGSTRVVGLNLPRIAFEMRRDCCQDYRPYIDRYLDTCHKILFSHRFLIRRMIDAGALPLYSAGWIELSKQYGTFGFIGAYEFLDILGKDITSAEGSDYLVDVLTYINEKIDSWSREDKVSYNVEQIPGESMAVRLAQIDQLLGYSGSYEVDLYSNQYVPLIKDADIFTRFQIQGKLDSLTSGGSILHLNIDDGASLTPSQIRLLMEVARATKTVYFAVNRVFVRCVNNHYAVSNNGQCPICKGAIKDQFTRVVGFVVPTKSWHEVRQKEFRKRVFYSASDRLFSC